jgi:hypothetical protein
MNDDQESAERLQAVLQGAFAGSPTRLQDIPKRNGKKRAVGKNQRRRRQRKKRAA